MYVVFIAVLILIDQITKYIVSIQLQNGREIDIIKNIFSLSYVENRGIAFGMMQGGRWFFVVFTILILLAYIYYYNKVLKYKKDIFYNISLILIVSGAIGNFIDRVHLGYVIDFLYFKLINFPVFNLADIYVVIGAILYVIVNLFLDNEENNNG